MMRAIRRGMQRAVVGLAAALACARPGEPGAPAEPRPVASDEPAGVDPALLARAELRPGEVEEKCAEPLHRARCLQARAHPAVRFTWTLVWNDVSSDDGEMRARMREVVERLRADGAREIYPPLSSSWSVTVVAPYPAVRGAMTLPYVRMVEVGCADDDLEFCACERLRVDQCEAHAFCQQVFGHPDCREPARLAGCTRAEMCQTVVSRAVDPRGLVWEFSSGCRPDQPGWQPLVFKTDPRVKQPPCPRAR